jgi:hypothetical protein
MWRAPPRSHVLLFVLMFHGFLHRVEHIHALNWFSEESQHHLQIPVAADGSMTSNLWRKQEQSLSFFLDGERLIWPSFLGHLMAREVHELLSHALGLYTPFEICFVLFISFFILEKILISHFLIVAPHASATSFPRQVLISTLLFFF